MSDVVAQSDLSGKYHFLNLKTNRKGDNKVPAQKNLIKTYNRTWKKSANIPMGNTTTDVQSPLSWNLQNSILYVNPLYHTYSF